MFSDRRRPSATWCPCGTNLSLRDASMSSSLQGSTTIAGRRKFHTEGGLNFETHLRPPLPFFFDFLFLSLLISHGSPFRPGVWRSQDDYLFLYCALEAYITNNGTTIPRWGCHLFWHKYMSTHQWNKKFMMSHSRKLSLKDFPSSSPPSSTWESSNTSSQPCWFGTVEKWISTERMRSGKNPHYHY